MGAALREIEAEEAEDRYLSGERLGRRHSDLDADAGVDARVRFAVDRGFLVVDDGDDGSLPFVRPSDGHQRIDRLPGLGYRHDEGPVGDVWVTHPEFRGDHRLHRRGEELLPQVFCCQSGMVCRSAGDEVDMIEVHGEPCQPGNVDLRPLLRHLLPDRFADRSGLFVDLFQHEVLVPALLDRDRIERDPVRRPDDLLPGEVEDPVTAGGQFCQLVVGEELDLARLTEEGRYVRTGVGP